MKIILMTIKKVLKRESVNHQGEATMPEFNPMIMKVDADQKYRIENGRKQKTHYYAIVGRKTG
jgi:hypothetical protein